MGLPRKHNLDQWKKAKAKAGKDIGEKTEKIGGKDANLVHIDNATDRKISTYEEYISNKEGYAHWNMGKPGKKKSKINEDLDMNLQEAPSAKETKDKIKLFNGGKMGPTEEPLYGNANYKQVINPANQALDLLRIGKHVSFNGWDGFINKVENGRVFIEKSGTREIIPIKLSEFFRKMKLTESVQFEDLVRTEGNPDGIDPELLYDRDPLDEEELETDDELDYPAVNELEDEVGTDDYYQGHGIDNEEEEISENMLPKPCPEVQCMECGEWVCATRNKKIGHLQNKHNIKPDVDDYKLKNALKDYFTSY